MVKSAPVPDVLLVERDGSDAGVADALERMHVQKVYDAVAQEWHGTRYKAWPRVVDFVSGLPSNSLVADLGCGNGKMAPSCRDCGHYAVGCDFSAGLVRIAVLEMGMQAQVADALALPYRDGVFDAAMSIAVLHHISSVERRRLLLEETFRVLRPGGRALFYAWAMEQTEGRSGHVFDSQDVFVPFHQRAKPPPAESPAESSAELAAAPAGAGVAAGSYDPNKRAYVYQRYCHVYRQGELLELVSALPHVRVLDEYYDTGNWCILAEKLA